FGQDVQKLSRGQLALMRRQIGVVFQDFRLIDHLTVYENVTLPLRIAGKREADYRDNVTELLRWVGLGHQMDSRPETLSGGEKQRAAIARAVIARPRLIVADEPTGNVDPEMGIRLLRLLDELNKMGTTVLIATHDNYIWSNFNHPRLHLEDQHIQRLPPEQLVDV
ncbi:MAG: ATP-binding cassette domain-containing protein, partial [PS1 clade bacterium]|nr:ATP-binding cassette domain-containing protein [PS1 clade bacterium]